MAFSRGNSARQSSSALLNFRLRARLADSTTPTTPPSGNVRYIRTTNTLIGCTVPPRLLRRQIKRLAVTDWERIANSNEKCSKGLAKQALVSCFRLYGTYVIANVFEAPPPFKGEVKTGWPKAMGMRWHTEPQHRPKSGTCVCLISMIKYDYTFYPIGATSCPPSNA